ncbi:hypothetical protein PRIPAC_97352 [Pristionchus pacificus]|uniref:Uncharacterized protein n=1 Tax=Pristionchus pacificus TaxID=54126 RepID=A0A2A6B3H9_PRIPA|nr:hypothetical protein PRIPAC_97352 [Pristionchus pacificus]|eukprot:PDM60430.1 hypothetical protein PRIPAC_54255 [Pristionchus pacificus]
MKSEKHPKHWRNDPSILSSNPSFSILPHEGTMLTVQIGMLIVILWCGIVFAITVIIDVVRSRSSSNRRVEDIEAGHQNPPDIDPDSHQRLIHNLLDLIDSRSRSTSDPHVDHIESDHPNPQVDPDSSQRQLQNLLGLIDSSRFAYAARSIWRSPMTSNNFPDLKSIALSPPSSNQAFMQDCSNYLASPEYAEEVRSTLPQVVAFQAGMDPPPPRAAAQPAPQPQHQNLFSGPPPGFHAPPPPETGRSSFYPRGMAPSDEHPLSLDDLYEEFRNDEISLSHIRAFHQMMNSVLHQMERASAALHRFIEWEWLRNQQKMQQEVIRWTYCHFNVMMPRPGQQQQLQQANRPVQVVQPMQHQQQHQSDARPSHQLPLYMRRGQIAPRQRGAASHRDLTLPYKQNQPWRDDDGYAHDPYAQPTFEQHLHYTAAQLNNYRAHAQGAANHGGHGHYYGAQNDENDYRRSSY